MADQDSFHELWNAAIVEYEKQTKRKCNTDDKLRQYRTLSDLETALSEDNQAFSEYREKNRKVYTTLAKCVEPLQPLLSVVQSSLGNTPYTPVCAVFGAALYLLKACTSVSKAYDGVEELFQHIADITARLRSYNHRNLEESLRQKMTSMLAFIMEVMGKAEALIKRKRFGQWFRSVFVQEDEIRRSIDKLRRFVEGEVGIAVALTYGVMNEMNQTSKVMRRGIDSVLANQRQTISEADERKVTAALSTPAHDQVLQEYESNMEKLAKGTGHWLLNDDKFQAWEKEQAPILWVLGQVGVGKTMLAARTTEYLQEKYPQHSDIPSLTSVSYICFKEGDNHLQDCLQLWKTAALQISKANDRFKKHVVSALEKNSNIFASARRIWKELFLDFFMESSISQTATSLAFIIVDGLNEGSENEQEAFLTSLAELVHCTTNETKCRIQVAVFARPSIKSVSGYEMIGVRQRHPSIDVVALRNNSDIDAYIRERLNKVDVLITLSNRGPAAQKECKRLAAQIYKSVMSRSQGMFLWAGLVFDQIRTAPSPEAIVQALKIAPKGLDEMLHHVFQRLHFESSLQQTYLRELLTWVYCAYQPLKIAELYVLLQMTAEQHCYMLEDDLRKRYSSLFNVTGIAPATDGDESNELGEQELRSVCDSLAPFATLDEQAATDTSDHETDFGEDDDDLHTSDLNDTFATDLQAAVQEDNTILAHWHTTTVTFSHTGIRDYLGREGNPASRQWDDTMVVPENLRRRHFGIAMACLDLLDHDIVDKHAVWDLLVYAQRNWVRHLAEVENELHSIGKDHGSKVAKLLTNLFHDGNRLLKSSSACENEFINVWFSTKQHSSLVRRIIVNHIDELADDQKEWALEIQESARALFKPLTAACARRWLTKKGWDDSAYLKGFEYEVWIMYAASTLNDDGSNAAGFEYLDINWAMNKIPMEEIERLADNERIPRSEHWYVGMAWLLKEAKKEDYTKKSIEYFHEALAIKPGGWKAMEGLACCYGDNFCQFQEAINWMSGAIACVPRSESFANIDLLLKERLSGWQLDLGADKAALESARATYVSSKGRYNANGTAIDHSILRTIRHYITALYNLKQYGDLASLLYELHEQKTSVESQYVWLVFLEQQSDAQYSMDLFGKLSQVIDITDNGKLARFIVTTLDKAVRLDTLSVADTQRLKLAVKAGDWHYHHAKNPRLSVQFYHSVVALIDHSTEHTKVILSKVRTRAAAQLSSTYFTMATRARLDGEDCSDHIDQLARLSRHEQGGRQHYFASYPALLYSVWLRKHGNAKRDSWMDIVRPSVKQALWLLVDDDPLNDQYAYAQLGRALLFAGDARNATIALGITTRPMALALAETMNIEEASTGSQALQQEPVSAESQQPLIVHQTSDLPPPNSMIQHADKAEGGKTPTIEDVNPKYAGFIAFWKCNGPCTTEQSLYRELHFCCICNDVCFCEKCIKLVKNDAVPEHICSADHEHVQAYPMTEDAKRIVTALVDRRFEEQQEWLDALNREWQDSPTESNTTASSKGNAASPCSLSGPSSPFGQRKEWTDLPYV